MTKAAPQLAPQPSAASVAEIVASGYGEPVGLEYKPSGRGDPFAWMGTMGAVKA